MKCIYLLAKVRFFEQIAKFLGSFDNLLIKYLAISGEMIIFAV